MSDTSTPTEPKPAETPKAPETTLPPAEAPKPKKQLLDNLVVKFLFSLVAWAAPLPVAIVVLRLWFTNFAPEEQSATDPFQSLRHTITSFSGSVADYIPLAALVPSALLLSILYRTRTGRILSIAMLCACAVGEIIAMNEAFGGLGAP